MRLPNVKFLNGSAYQSECLKKLASEQFLDESIVILQVLGNRSACRGLHTRLSGVGQRGYVPRPCLSNSATPGKNGYVEIFTGNPQHEPGDGEISYALSWLES